MADTYEVIEQKQTTAANETGTGFAEAMRITFRTTDGVVNSVTVPMTAYSVDNVRAAIEARLAVLNGVRSL